MREHSRDRGRLEDILKYAQNVEGSRRDRFLGITAAMTQNLSPRLLVRPYLPSAAYKSIMSNNPRGYEVFKSR